MSIITLKQLPKEVQGAFSDSVGGDPHSINSLKIKSSTFNGHNGMFVVPDINYDFAESNYAVYVINLTKVNRLDVGPASATMYEKTDPNLKSYIAIVSYGDTDNQIYECV